MSANVTSAPIDDGYCKVGKDSPWGPIQDRTVIARGIVRVSTAGHGGYYVHPCIRDTMPQTLRGIQPYAGDNWYEEDEDWCFVALAFPVAFPAESVYMACEQMRGKLGRPGVAAWLDHDPEGQAVAAIAAAWFEEHRDDYRIGSAGTAGNGWSCSWYRISDNAQRTTRTAAYPPRHVMSAAELDELEAQDRKPIPAGARNSWHAFGDGLREAEESKAKLFPGQQIGLLGERYNGGITGEQTTLGFARPSQIVEELDASRTPETPAARNTKRLF